MWRGCGGKGVLGFVVGGRIMGGGGEVMDNGGCGEVV